MIDKGDASAEYISGNDISRCCFAVGRLGEQEHSWRGDSEREGPGCNLRLL